METRFFTKFAKRIKTKHLRNTDIMGFFKSFFSGKQEKPETEKQKNDQKNFEIFKYDGMRAQRMGRPDYAIKCFTEALALQEDFETMSYLSQV